jgi:hypothetical protein
MDNEKNVFVHNHNSTLRFGKHKGKSVETVLVNDAQWLSWAIAKIPTFKVSETLHKDITACVETGKNSKTANHQNYER